MDNSAEKDIVILGETNFRNQNRAFGIMPDDRRRHIYVIGKTGVGKSTLLENMIAQDIAGDRGVCLIDPHGDTVEKLLDAVPPHRVNDVVYFDPSDVDNPVAFNVLEVVDPAYKYLIASGLVSSLKKIWADSWGPRLEYILRNTILALLDYPSSTILGILRMLTDKAYRKKVVEKVADPVVKAFWVNEFAQYNERFRTEAISPIQNKVGQLLSSAIIRNIMAQPKSTIDMQDIMDNGKILLINVSKGKIGEDNSALLGAMIINRIQLAAMDRASIPEEERRDFYLYVDEFQNFATESFANILSEARKYRLNLTMAHQYVAQMEEEVSDAVFGNVGTIVSFRVGAVDAEYLEQEFSPIFTQTDLVNLDKYNAYIKLMINGISSKPFSMHTLAPTMEHFGKADIVRRVSRERFGRKRTVVEDKVKRWSGVALGESEKNNDEAQSDRKKWGGVALDQTNNKATPVHNQPHRSSSSQQQRDKSISYQTKNKLVDVVIPPHQEVITDLASALAKEKNKPFTGSSYSKPSVQMHQITCDRCGKSAEVPFKPDPNKPVYCKECLEKVRSEKKTNTQPASKTSVVEISKKFTGPPPPSPLK